MAEITWLNHASFAVTAGDVTLVCDPWLTGTAFDDGWDHLVPSHHPDWDTVTHIWFSHEHPDHFAPGTLMAIPEARRREITVLYQHTKDRKVIDWCATKGFRTKEVGTAQLGPDLTVTCHPWLSGDSYLLITADGTTILNLNDCVVSTKSDARLIAQRLGFDKLDVLLTQFSYANWSGNPDQPERRRADAQAKLKRIDAQVRALDPATVIPFASFIWFCHEDNHWMNDETVPTAKAAKQLGDKAVVLHPGDTWTIGTPHDSAAAIDHYTAAEATVPTRPLRSSPTVPLSDLTGHASALVHQLTAANTKAGMWLLEGSRQLPTLRVWLTDHDQAVALDRRGLHAAPLGEADCDIAVASEAFDFFLTNFYGGGTLLVSGRFTAPPGGDLRRFRRWANLANATNRGVTLLRPWAEVSPRVRKLLGRHP